MTRLPYDVSRCVRDECPIRWHCLRYVAEDPGRPLSLICPEHDGDDCRHMIPLNDGDADDDDG